MKRKINKKNLSIVSGTLIGVILLVIGALYYLKQQDQSYIVKESIDVTLLPLHQYDIKAIRKNELGHLSYTDPKTGVKARHGIDVSSHQKEIDWAKVKAAGIEFAFIRVGYRGYESGKINLDEYFHANMKAATEQGIDVGVYFFSQAINDQEVIDEANFVLKEISGYKLSYPIAYDLEDIDAKSFRTSELTPEEKTNFAMIFCGRIEKVGYKPMVYTNLTWATKYFDITDILNYDIWFAQYNHQPDFNFRFEIWQYTESGKIDGVNTPVDLNLDFSNYLT